MQKDDILMLKEFNLMQKAMDNRMVQQGLLEHILIQKVNILLHMETNHILKVLKQKLLLIVHTQKVYAQLLMVCILTRKVVIL